MNIQNVLKNKNSKAFITKADVNFISRAGKFNIKLFNGAHSELRVMLSYDYLWTNIRVHSGAYC